MPQAQADGCLGFLCCESPFFQGSRSEPQIVDAPCRLQVQDLQLRPMLMATLTAAAHAFMHGLRCETAPVRECTFSPVLVDPRFCRINEPFPHEMIGPKNQSFVWSK